MKTVLAVFTFALVMIVPVPHLVDNKQATLAPTPIPHYGS